MISRATKSRLNNKREAAFTLLELALVTLIILVLIGLSTPLFKKTFSALAAQDAAFTMAKVVQYGQERSMVERKNYKVVFDFKGRRYRLLSLGISAGQPVYTRISGRFGRDFIMPRGVTLTGASGRALDRSEAVLYPDGRCDPVSVVVNTKEASYGVSASGFGNFVKVKEITDAR